MRLSAGLLLSRLIALRLAAALGRRNAQSVKEASVRRIRYSVAMSLDGYIAGPKGEADWIIMDPEIDFAGLFE